MKRKQAMEPENVIKGRIAEALIEELLRSSGNDVYRFGYESILQNLVQTGSHFDRRNKNAHQLRSIPDFVVLNAGGNNFFVEVKFRSSPEWLLRDSLLKLTTEYWQSKLILVTIVKPYFRIVDLQSLTDDRCAFQPLEADKDFHVTREALEIFEPLVERFLLNGKANSNSFSAENSQAVKA
jgi:hypothetical protein